MARLTLKPFVKKKPATVATGIFVKDRELGWKLKPNVEDKWGGVKVKINSKGLRGPEINYRKLPHVRRILFLGDSVTFGYLLERDDQTYPSQVARILKKKLLLAVESINAGVGGYSPWQEYSLLCC